MDRVKKSVSQVANAVQRVGKLGQWVAGFCILIMVIVISVDVIGRYFFNSPFKYAYDVTEFTMAGSVLLAMAYTQAIRGHINVDLVVSHLPKRMKSILGIFSITATLFLFSLVTWMGWELAWDKRAALTMSASPLPLFWPMLLVPIGGLLICLQLVIDLYRDVASV